MRRALCAFAAFVASVSATRAGFQPPADYDFARYVSDFGRQYDAAEYARRKQIFEANLAKIHEVNQAGRTWKAGVNHMTDMSEPELKALRGHRPEASKARKLAEASGAQFPPVEDLPKSVDWRQRGSVMTPVKNQGNCGSCWAFAATEALESHLAINTGVLAELAVQQIVSCMENPKECGGTGGCGGGTSELAFDYVKENGLADMWKYGYSSGLGGDNGKCSWTNKTMGSYMTVDGYKMLPLNDGASLQAAVATVGPTIISVDARTWHLYHSGVFDNCDTKSPEIDHAVVLAGYGFDEATQLNYWLVRNSWTALFGEAGYIRVKRATSAADEPCGMDEKPQEGIACKGETAPQKVCGYCGVVFHNSYPTGARLGNPTWQPHAEVSVSESITV